MRHKRFKLDETRRFLLVLLFIIAVWTMRLFPFKFGVD